MRSLSGFSQSRIVSVAFDSRRETTIGGADSAAVPVADEVSPDHRLELFEGEALWIKGGPRKFCVKGNKKHPNSQEWENRPIGLKGCLY